MVAIKHKVDGTFRLILHHSLVHLLLGLPDFDQLSLHIAPNTRSIIFTNIIDYITETVDSVGIGCTTLL